jgi:hypothetical protein
MAPCRRACLRARRSARSSRARGRQHRAGREAHQRGDDAGLLVEQQRLDLAAGKAGFLPFHVGGAHDVGMLVGG